MPPNLFDSNSKLSGVSITLTGSYFVNNKFAIFLTTSS